MIQLIKEYFETAIRMNKATEKAFTIAQKSYEKNIEFLDNAINHDLMRQQREVIYWEEQMKQLNRHDQTTLTDH
jgi:hypothetical protein